jgi:hypothetical protein
MKLEREMKTVMGYDTVCMTAQEGRRPRLGSNKHAATMDATNSERTEEWTNKQTNRVRAP